MTTNILSFDLEKWHDSEFVKEKKDPDLVEEGAEKILKILKECGTKATFFVTGRVAEQYPELVRRIHKVGHEIASHSYNHKMINKMSPEEAKKDIKKSVNLLKKIIGKKPVGFRAPSWSVSKKDFWIYSFLESLGLKYSSSLFPFNAGLYGDFSFPVLDFKPIKNKDFKEYPISPAEILGIRIPFSGGIYFRIMPSFLIKFFIGRLNKKNQPAIVYLHPWEFCTVPKAKTTIIGKITTYFGLKNNEKKLRYILKSYKFSTFMEKFYGRS